MSASIAPGAKIRATNRTYGLAPSRPYGELETVATVDSWDSTITTVEGNCYLNGDYLYIAPASAA